MSFDMQQPSALPRRTFLSRSGLALGAAAAGMLLADDAVAAPARVADPLAPKRPHFAPRAKSIIYLHMIGAPSQLDLFDPKPKLNELDGEVCPASLVEGKDFAFIGGEMRLAGSGYKFRRHGESGQTVSELLPHFSNVVDDVTIVHSLHTDEINHAPAQMFLHSGFGRGGRPGIGSWLAYGLGTVARDLPAYVVMLSGQAGGAGSSLWSSGFLPSVYQGVQFRSDGDPVLFLSNPPGHSRADRRNVLDAVRAMNETHLAEYGDPEIATRIRQYEMAFRMQSAVPELADLSEESKHTLDLYGITPGKPSFAADCLLARRLVERGVRIVEIYDSDWDHHNNLDDRLRAKCRDIDQGMAALVADLKQRGLLDDVIVVWGSEFGRTPLGQGQDGEGNTSARPGRDHHKDAYTVWLAGGGLKAGFSYGETDEFGFEIASDGVHVHDLNATLLHLLGFDHKRLTYTYQGRPFRLTDVHGEVVEDLLA
ncbi:MAG: DUF1501 domain-containing protein [Planctomycetaceae bacterium]|nr:DUF1501 domain-containing protein [Planctomycetaceae bacterium]